MTLGRWVTPFCRDFESIPSKLSSFIWRKRAYFADHEAARSPFLVPVLHKIGRGTARLRANAKTLQGAITSVPDKDVFAVAIGAKRINETLSNLRHRQIFLLPRLVRSLGEARGKGGSKLG